jgi:hypothetical protein
LDLHRCGVLLRPAGDAFYEQVGAKLIQGPPVACRHGGGGIAVEAGERPDPGTDGEQG